MLHFTKMGLAHLLLLYYYKTDLKLMKRERIINAGKNYPFVMIISPVFNYEGGHK
jgi:hypothetical protein